MKKEPASNTALIELFSPCLQ